MHYNSSKSAQLQAHAYAQGTDIHLGSGQEKHLPHEAWHVVQQKQGRERTAMQMKAKIDINDDAGLEKEAVVMGAKALQMVFKIPYNINNPENNPNEVKQTSRASNCNTVQRKILNYNGKTELLTDDRGKFIPRSDGEGVNDTMRSETLFPIKHILTNQETMVSDKSVNLKGGHLIPVRWGGKGNYPNVQPWLGTFEDGKWLGFENQLKQFIETQEKSGALMRL